MVKISLPLSATALRHGSDLLLKLAADADIIRGESALRGPVFKPTISFGEPGKTVAESMAKFDNVLNFGKDPMTATAGTATASPDDTELLQTGEPCVGTLYTTPANPKDPGFAELGAGPSIKLAATVSDDPAVVESMLADIYAANPEPGSLGSAEMDAALAADEAKLEALGAFDAPPAAPAAPVFDLQMTDKAGAWSLAEFREQGWTDDNLVEAGYAERVARPFTSAPAPAVPSAPPAPGTAPSVSSNSGGNMTASVELDKNGLPWDARIHSDAANKLTAEGRWKRKRGVADELVTQVEAELRAVMAVPAPSPIAQAANQMSALSATLAPVVPAPGSDPATFPALTLWLSGHLNGGRIAQADVALAVQSTGLALLPDLNKRPDLIPAVVEHLRRNRGL